MHAQQQAYFLAQYERLRPVVLGAIQEHQSELMAVIAKISDDAADSLISSEFEGEEAPTDAEIIEIKKHLIGVYVAAFLGEQMPWAEQLENAIERTFAQGQHDGRALRIGREAPRH